MIRTLLSESFYQLPGILPREPAGCLVSGQDVVVDSGFSQTLTTHVPRPGHEAKGSH